MRIKGMKTKSIFALYNKKEKSLVSFISSRNPEDSDGPDLSYELYIGEFSPIWTTTSQDHAVKVLNTPGVSWYNANYENPEHNLDPNEIEVIEFVARI
jgi:hypothetical protein